MKAEAQDLFDTRDDHAFDALAEAGDPARAFLRARWFVAGPRPATRGAILSGTDGTPLAAMAFTERRVGPLTLPEIAGCYWPFRSIPLAPEADRDTLSAALRRNASATGRVFRLGPVASDDPLYDTFVPAAEKAGWHILRRDLGTLFELDLAGLTAAGEWPSAKTQRKNRWRRRRLEEDGGPLRTEVFTGADWTAAQRDAMAAIEAASWLGKLADGGDTKFRDPRMRAHWEALCADPVLARMLFGSVLWIGAVPAAFTFGVAAGDTRYYIANNYDERFTQFGPGRVLLYEDFARAADLGIRRISWGVGDAGYKTEMGAKAGPALHDLLFVRGKALAQVARLVWKS